MNICVTVASITSCPTLELPGNNNNMGGEVTAWSSIAWNCYCMFTLYNQGLGHTWVTLHINVVVLGLV